MKQHCKWIVPAVVVLALGLPFVGQAQGQGQPVYTWVDKSGVRHYSDTPHNPKAALITVRTSAATSAPAVTTVPVAGVNKMQHMMLQISPREMRVARAARCTKLRRHVKQLQSARRVEVTRNGKQQFYSGDDLVQFRRQMHKRMQAACAQPSQ